MAALSVAAVFDAKRRAQFAAAAGQAIAVASPLVTNLPWDGAPALLREYLAAGPGRGRFAFFPCAAYVGFGLAAGTLVKRTAEERFERLMQWSVLIGFALVFSGQYFSSIPYSIYTKSSFWTDSPALILIRVGISLLLMSGSYLWTEYGAGAGWSWVQTLGRNSLMVYWVHVMLVYGDIIKPLKRALWIPQSALATLAVVLLMIALSLAWTWWKSRKIERWRATTAKGPAQPARG
jgi:fucose 4-O-acetylase-like acetyltransferase